jgi:hypothetical protein
VRLLEENNVDMAIGSWYSEKADSSIRIRNTKLVENPVFDRDTLLYYIYDRENFRAFAYMWDKLYTRKLFFDGGGELLLFDEDMKLGGDVLYLAQLAVRVRRAVFCNRAFYHYRIREGSGSHTENLDRLADWVDAYEKTVALLSDEKIKAGTVALAEKFLAFRCSNLVEAAIRQKNRQLAGIYQAKMKKLRAVYRQLNLGEEERLRRYDRLMNYSDWED